MSNNSNKDNARSSGRKKGDFGEPSDDSFRNYMANKIDKQREQFGLVIPPPPSPPQSLLNQLIRMMMIVKVLLLQKAHITLP